MIFAVNPFAESTMAENIQAEEFVQIFSPAIINSAQELFRSGNVVLKGAPGSGKSMLLTLLKPETQAAYALAKQPFPIPKEVAKFIGAGINLARAGAQDIGTRLSRNATDAQIQELVAIFGDFVNYYITRDLLKSVVSLIKNENQQLNELVGIKENSFNNLNNLAVEIANNPCWGGYLTPPDSIETLLENLELRLQHYRAYFNFRVDSLPENISSTITPIGEPIAVTADLLRKKQILEDDTSIFIRIDQLEELYYLEKKFNLGSLFRQVINKALAMRDPRVSYRIGVRGFAWEEELNVYGSSARLEQGRDFSVVDLDALLKRAENAKVWVFKSLAEDVFRRRLQASHFEGSDKNAPALIRQVLGKGNTHEDLGVIYAGKSPQKILDLDLEWPDEWKQYLLNLSETSPLQAKFGEAWARQRGKSDVLKLDFPKNLPPWAAEGKKYWRKERNDQALLQIAAKNKSRLNWAGVDDVIGLSGGNTLCFITICKHIWQAWLRSPESRNSPTLEIPQIEWRIQATGIYDASRTWFEKIIPQGHNGDTRRRLIQMLGIWFNQELTADKPMSNPGHNGISLTTDDLESDQKIREILSFSVDFGDLFQGPHTTKLKDKKPRIKWYLAPILCPYFRIPHIRTKEPIYTNIIDLRKRMVTAEVLISADVSTLSVKENSHQMGLFDKVKS